MLQQDILDNVSSQVKCMFALLELCDSSVSE